MGHSVRISRIILRNFKNTHYGEVGLINKRKDFKASILGMYGQNGSGKTALIDAISLLKYVLCGQSIPQKFADYVNIDAESAQLSFELDIKIEDASYHIWYDFSIRKSVDDISVNMAEDDAQVQVKVEVYDEVLSYSFSSGEKKQRKTALIDTRSGNVFSPKAKYMELLGDDSFKETDLLVTKRIVQTTSRSFIFSKEMINLFRRNCTNPQYLSIIDAIMVYGNREIFVINTENSGLISLNALPLAFKIKNDKAEAVGNVMLPLNGTAAIPEDAYNVVIKVIKNMNIVLEQIVPGLTIGVENLGTVMSKEGEVGRTIQLMSLKNGKAIPFQYESEGIKKIVSILQLLIVVYNNPSITVAIDELDAGIFEYLLGEILSIISEKGKGQLVFTSHNLRPLETIDKGFIAFTTTNPGNRYIRMTNVKGNNNLRNFYFRDIVLGEQSEEVYSPTNNYDISLAFREAGESFVS